MINIWNYLLSILVYEIGVMVTVFPDAKLPLMFASPMAQGFFVFCQLAYVYFSVFDLTMFGIYITFVFVMAVPKMVLKVKGMMTELIALAGVLGL